MNIEFDGIDRLAGELNRFNSVEFDRVCKKQLGQMLNRARKNLKLTGEGTPVGKDRIVKGKKRQGGELRISSSSDGKNEMGYSAEYAFRLCGAYKTGQKRQKLSLRVV